MGTSRVRQRSTSERDQWTCIICQVHRTYVMFTLCPRGWCCNLCEPSITRTGAAPITVQHYPAQVLVHQVLYMMHLVVHSLKHRYLRCTSAAQAVLP